MVLLHVHDLSLTNEYSYLVSGKFCNNLLKEKYREDK